jgi:pimeloyl-ACP methyl ester carboxylesterase
VVPTLLIIGDSDIVRSEHAVDIFRLLGGVPGDIDDLPNSRRAVLPGTTHVTLVERINRLLSMIEQVSNAWH